MMIRMISLLSLIMCAGCQIPEDTVSHELTILKRSNQCRVDSPSLRQLQSQDEIRKIFLQDSMLGSRDPLPDVDLSTHVIMLLSMGQRPSAGYRIELDPDGLHEESGSLRLSVEFLSPEGGAVATVITSPCLIFSIKREGLQEIVAGDTGLVFRF